MSGFGSAVNDHVEHRIPNRGWAESHAPAIARRRHDSQTATATVVSHTACDAKKIAADLGQRSAACRRSGTIFRSMLAFYLQRVGWCNIQRRQPNHFFSGFAVSR